MKPSPESLRADALLQLERTRTAWLVRCANNQAPAADHPAQGHGLAGLTEGLGLGSPLNAILSEWLANELAARLWPDETAHAGDGTDPDPSRPPPPPPLTQSLVQPLADWAVRHPWLSVTAGVLAGSLAMSQRQRLLRWVISAGLPWLTSQAAVVAVPLLAQWLARQAPTQAPSTAAEDTAASEPDSANTGPVTATHDAAPDLRAANSPAARSPA